MLKVLPATILAVALVVPTITAVHAATAQVVQISLSDSSADPATRGMQMKAEPTTVKAGRVTFKAVNQSKDLVHEVLVVPAPAGGKDLPYDAKSNTIDEKRVHSRGEISDLKPGAQGSRTLSLKPGTYLLVCNQPGHYKEGMVAKLTVEK
ncbi:MAG: plastocyanin/azurin family copper-binding protein [Deltaproteobacteria bacterium]